MDVMENLEEATPVELKIEDVETKEISTYILLKKSRK
jgi:hypothetical protein